MAKPKRIIAEKRLMRRYLIWCYKTTKEALDRIDRKFTQLQVDYHLRDLFSKSEEIKRKKAEGAYANKIAQFDRYIKEKEQSGLAQKFVDKTGKQLQPEYWYLQQRLQAIEKTIGDFFSTTELKTIQNDYEEEMTRRIWEAREHT